uniref:Histone deacetylase 8 n=1 Tax=Cacopsylla melanoneura TaxID=428564 RepID=A0A8D9ASA8_9HEMI
MDKKVLCIYDENIIQELDEIDHIKNRAKLVFSLIESYSLFNAMTVIKSVPATYEELTEFHSSLYIDTIKDLESQTEEDLEEFGLTGDCPVLDEMYKFISYVGGGSLTAAKGLISGKYNLAINWCGGWHHAQRDMAEGFCYVNDIVLAILQLNKKFNRILYVDLDVHHGNGVENAFSSTPKVFTFSLHRNGFGFYPNTGDLNDVGTGKGKYYTANVPLQSGTSDQTYLRVFCTVIDKIRETYQPECLVVQCGADSLARDKLGDFNVSCATFGSIITKLISWSLPTLFLGGGGYNIHNTARYWTSLTSIITSTPISVDIPDECEDFMEFGPDFTLTVDASYGRRDENSEQELSTIIATLVHNITNYVTSPLEREKCLREQNVKEVSQRKRCVGSLDDIEENGSQGKRSCVEKSTTTNCNLGEEKRMCESKHIEKVAKEGPSECKQMIVNEAPRNEITAKTDCSRLLPKMGENIENKTIKIGNEKESYEFDDAEEINMEIDSKDSKVDSYSTNISQELEEKKSVSHESKELPSSLHENNGKYSEKVPEEYQIYKSEISSVPSNLQSNTPEENCEKDIISIAAETVDVQNDDIDEENTEVEQETSDKLSNLNMKVGNELSNHNMKVRNGLKNDLSGMNPDDAGIEISKELESDDKVSHLVNVIQSSNEGTGKELDSEHKASIELNESNKCKEIS